MICVKAWYHPYGLEPSGWVYSDDWWPLVPCSFGCSDVLLCAQLTCESEGLFTSQPYAFPRCLFSLLISLSIESSSSGPFSLLADNYFLLISSHSGGCFHFSFPVNDRREPYQIFSSCFTLHVHFPVFFLGVCQICICPLLCIIFISCCCISLSAFPVVFKRVFMVCKSGVHSRTVL